jgi:hypothetical protein
MVVLDAREQLAGVLADLRRVPVTNRDVTKLTIAGLRLAIAREVDRIEQLAERRGRDRERREWHAVLGMTHGSPKNYKGPRYQR